MFFYFNYYFQGGAGSVGGWENKTSKKTNAGNNNMDTFITFLCWHMKPQHTQKHCQRSSNNLSVAELLNTINIMSLSPAETKSQIQENCKNGECTCFMLLNPFFSLIYCILQALQCKSVQCLTIHSWDWRIHFVLLIVQKWHTSPLLQHIQVLCLKYWSRFLLYVFFRILSLMGMMMRMTGWVVQHHNL